MAFGVPIVAFDLEEHRTQADGAAVYVSPGDVPAFALAISQLLDDPARRAEMGSLAGAGLRKLMPGSDRKKRF